MIIYIQRYLVLTTRKNHYMHALGEYMKPTHLIQLLGATFLKAMDKLYSVLTISI